MLVITILNYDMCTMAIYWLIRGQIETHVSNREYIKYPSKIQSPTASTEQISARRSSTIVEEVKTLRSSTTSTQIISETISTQLVSETTSTQLVSETISTQRVSETLM